MRSLAILLTTVIIAQAAVDVSKFKKPVEFYRQTASYGDVLKAFYLMDFNLSEQEKNTIKDFMLVKNTVNDNEAKMFEKKFGALDSIASVKLNSGVDPISKDAYLDGFFMQINYDLMAQLLDPKFKKSEGFSIPLEKGAQHDEATVKILDVVSQRWKPGFSSKGVRLPGGGLKNFYEGTDEEIKARKEDVYQMYLDFDDFVMRTLNEASFKYQTPIGTFPPIAYAANSASATSKQ